MWKGNDCSSLDLTLFIQQLSCWVDDNRLDWRDICVMKVLFSILEKVDGVVVLFRGRPMINMMRIFYRKTR